MIYTDTGQPHPPASAILAGLFLRAFCMSTLQSAGVVLLARGSLLSLATAFLISYLWASNSRAVVDRRVPWARFVYGLGGASGAFVTLWVAW